jgi:ankyrin repeat protein
MSATRFTQEEGNQFIIECHSDLETVKRKLAEKPELASAFNADMYESALGAAGHMGRSDIAETLLAAGAQMELATAAMMGNRAVVKEALGRDTKLAKSGGAHNIPVAFHAAMSGDTEIMQMLWNAGAEDEVRNALIGAVMKNRVDLVTWMLERGASKDVKTWDGKSPAELAEQLGFTELSKLLS